MRIRPVLQEDMMRELDDCLALVRGAALPDALGELDGAILATTARTRTAEARRTGAVAATAALLMGVAGSALPGTSVAAASPAPLAGLPPLAPSALLAR